MDRFALEELVAELHRRGYQVTKVRQAGLTSAVSPATPDLADKLSRSSQIAELVAAKKAIVARLRELRKLDNAPA